MDTGSAATAAGIDPKILDNWQTDGAFSVASWEHLGYDQTPEWDTSQESSQCADVADLGAFHDPLTNSLLDRSREIRNRCAFNLIGLVFPVWTTRGGREVTGLTCYGIHRKRDVTNETFNYVDGGVEGTGSGTISPRTMPSSTDDNFHADETWPHFHLFNSVAAGMSAGMSLEAPVMYPYGKGPNNSAGGAVIVDDVGEMHQGQEFPDASAEAIMFQQVPPSFPMMEQWPEVPHGIPMDTMAGQGTAPMAMNAQNNSKGHYQPSLRSLESRWINNLESQLPVTQMTPPTSLPASLQTSPAPQARAKPVQDGFHFKSENSSVAGDMSGLYDYSYSANDDASAFADRRVDEDAQWNIATPDHSSPESTVPGTGAFMVSEIPSDSLVSIPSRSRATSSAGQRASGRPTPLAMQSVATVRKRKNRNTQSMDQGQPKPLQIVQEDGQGGSIASADFVSPPRGARRKGPLSMVGRANAGLRRKNKDTCVQCRLNKRKVSVLDTVLC